MLLGPIGFEGALVFRKICSAAMIRLAKNKNSDFCASFFAIADSFPSSVRRKWAAARPICHYFQASSVFWCPVAIRNRKKVAILGVFLFLDFWIGLMPVLWAGWSGRSAWIDPAGRYKKYCRCLRPSMRANPFAGRHTGVLPTLSRLFSIAVSASALALIPSPHQLHCGIMIETVSKEL